MTKDRKRLLKDQIENYGDKARLKCNLEILDILNHFFLKYPNFRFWQLILMLKDYKSDFDLFSEESFDTKETLLRLLENK